MLHSGWAASALYPENNPINASTEIKATTAFFTERLRFAFDLVRKYPITARITHGSKGNPMASNNKFGPLR